MVGTFCVAIKRAGKWLGVEGERPSLRDIVQEGHMSTVHFNLLQNRAYAGCESRLWNRWTASLYRRFCIHLEPTDHLNYAIDVTWLTGLDHADLLIPWYSYSSLASRLHGWNYDHCGFRFLKYIRYRIDLHRKQFHWTPGSLKTSLATIVATRIGA